MDITQISTIYRTIFCKICNEDRSHMVLEFLGDRRWKCKSCGEYNQPEFDSLAEQILNPVEAVYIKLARLAWRSWRTNTLEILNSEDAKHQIQEIAQEMNGALTLVRHHVEGLLEAQFSPDDFYHDGFDGGDQPRKDLDGDTKKESEESEEDPCTHYDDGKNHGGL